MIQLPSTIPHPTVFLALAPEELVGTMLTLLRQRRESMFHGGNLFNDLWGNASRGQTGYPHEKKRRYRSRVQ